MRLDTRVEQIETAFGETPPFSSESLAASDRVVLLRGVGDEGYQLSLQDPVNRPISRDYLTHAVMLGVIPAHDLAGFNPMIESKEARAALSLHMLMSSVEQAPELLLRGVPSALEQLKPDADSPPHIRLIRS